VCTATIDGDPDVEDAIDELEDLEE